MFRSIETKYFFCRFLKFPDFITSPLNFLFKCSPHLLFQNFQHFMSDLVDSIKDENVRYIDDILCIDRVRSEIRDQK